MLMEQAAAAGLAWSAQVDVPWFLAGAMGVGVPAGIAAGSVVAENGHVLFLVSLIGGMIGGAALDYLSSTPFSTMIEPFTCYDVLTRAVGPACLLLVILVPGLRSSSSRSSAPGNNSSMVSVRPATWVAVVSLLLEPLFTAFILSNSDAFGTTAANQSAVGIGVTELLHRMLGSPTNLVLGAVNLGGGSGSGRRSKKAAAAAAVNAAANAISRARWLTGMSQVALWIATMLGLAHMALRFTQASRGARRTVGTYLTALKDLAARKRGTGGWARVERLTGQGGSCAGTAPNSSVPGGSGGWGGWRGERVGGSDGEYLNARKHSVLGFLYGRIAEGSNGDVDSCLYEASHPSFERGEVTIRGLYCSRLDVALTGKSTNNSCADHGAGIAGSTRPFYVTAALGSVTARTSVRTGFSPNFTEVFPLGLNCPIRGAVLVLAVMDSFETGRSGRGDRVVGQVHIPVDAADLVPGSTADMSGGGPTYRLKGEWELMGVVVPGETGARLGGEIVVRGPPDPNSAAGRLRRRESVGWYAR